MDRSNNQNYERMNFTSALVVEGLRSYYDPLIQTGKSIPMPEKDIVFGLKSGLEKDVKTLRLEGSPQSMEYHLESYELSGVSVDQLYEIDIAVKEELIKILDNGGLDRFTEFLGID